MDIEINGLIGGFTSEYWTAKLSDRLDDRKIVADAAREHLDLWEI